MADRLWDLVDIVRELLEEMCKVGCYSSSWMKIKQQTTLHAYISINTYICHKKNFVNSIYYRWVIFVLFIKI